MKKGKRMLAITLAGAMALMAMLTGCGASGSSSGDADAENFTWLVDAGVKEGFYDDWTENPTLNYFLDQEWDADGDGEGTKISLEITSPVAGAEKDNVNTLIATGEYMDVMSTSYISTPISDLYEEGMILDLTDYIDQYMPNYKAWMEANPELAKQLVNYIDGEAKYLQIYGVQDVQSPNFGGFMYRRDWIVKYGTNPETGEAFTGSYDENGDWSDDVVFPSGGTDPIYISDWEWMFEIFEKAMDDLGIEDGYCFQMYYPGYIQLGDFASGFGSINPLWYIDPESGETVFGATGDGFKAYIECLNTWYEKGWLDQQFDERSTDIFFNIDSASVYSGKVGAWYGGNGQMGNGLNTDGTSEEPGLQGICVYGAPQPINDKYGSADTQYKEPVSYYAGSMIKTSIVLTDKAADKDIATLLTALDYLYTYDGALLNSYGFSDEQQAEIQDDYYNEQGLTNGSYTMIEQDGETIPKIDTQIINVENLILTVQLPLGIGESIQSVEYGYHNWKQHGYDMWTKYTDIATIPSTITSQLSGDQATENSQISTDINTYMAQAVEDFITGRTDIDSEKDWQDYVDSVNAYSPETYTENINSVLK